MTRVLFLFALTFLMSEVTAAKLPLKVQSFLESYCTDCHYKKKQKGDIRLDNFIDLSVSAKIHLLNKIEEQFYLEQMPPADEDQPTSADRVLFSTWVDSQYVALKTKSKLKDKLRFSNYGNYVSHEKLFSGEIKEKAYTPGRRWLISSQIYNEKIKEFYSMPEKDLAKYKIRQNVKNPFIMPDNYAIHYYDNTSLSGGHLLTLLANAKWITKRQLLSTLVKSGEEVLEKVYMGGSRYIDEPVMETDQVFQDIILNKNVPSDLQLTAAIKRQFSLVLNRPPTKEDLAEYLAFIKKNIKMGGNSKGLQKMMVAVFMEEEIYYRSEFGSGAEDEFGRKLMAPIEAAYAISYALKDSIPDEALMKAATEGKLKTKEDFKQQILRLLADKSKEYPVDNYLWHGRYEIANPRILRFFRDFFAYPKMRDLFKDNTRYRSYRYGHVPSTTVKEADMLVEYFLELDKNVLENLITSDKYYVYHSGDNEKTGKKVKSLIKSHQKSYALIKGKDWRKNPKEFFTKLNMFKQSKNRGHDKYRLRTLTQKMSEAEESVGKGNRPIPFGRHEIELRAPHVYVYNFDHFDWDYEPIQPFSVPNRMGMLTHPAWLVAHSQNTATDPVKRGHWIRERLLAGRVPDIPISVEAVIPEDKNHTLRTRLASVTEQKACWKCHKQMNPLGYPFEAYDDFGRYRTMERLEHPDNITKKGTLKPNVPHEYKKAPLKISGYLKGTGDPELDGEVKDAIDMIQRLGKSARVRQSIIRHAFRYFMGRNEMLSDSQTLIDADSAYLNGGGSFNAVIVSLLTSDSFIYRK